MPPTGQKHLLEESIFSLPVDIDLILADIENLRQRQKNSGMLSPPIIGLFFMFSSTFLQALHISTLNVKTCPNSENSFDGVQPSLRNYNRLAQSCSDSV